MKCEQHYHTTIFYKKMKATERHQKTPKDTEECDSDVLDVPSPTFMMIPKHVTNFIIHFLMTHLIATLDLVYLLQLE